MLVNPFTPSEIVSSPDKFFGRNFEMQAVSRAINQGYVVIQGGVGIGKSSLLSRILLHMNGFDSLENSEYTIVVGNNEINSIDDVARMILEKLTTIESGSRKLKFNFKLIEYESTEAYSLFTEGRHLAALTRILKAEAFESVLNETRYLIIAIDEADKCARPLARFIRSISTELQLQGLKNIRFIFSGISPFYEAMIDEDEGVSRFISKNIILGRMDERDAEELLRIKFEMVARSSEESGFPIRIDPVILERILQLSGSHPHLLQLLGSHIVEQEVENPDEILDVRDLVGSLKSICYDSRGWVYQKLIHTLEIENKYYSFLNIIKLTKGTFPGHINRQLVEREIPREDIEWLFSRNFISKNSLNEYEIIDEFLRIRILIDEFEKAEAIEVQLIEEGFMSFDDWENLFNVDDAEEDN